MFALVLMFTVSFSAAEDRASFSVPFSQCKKLLSVARIAPTLLTFAYPVYFTQPFPADGSISPPYAFVSPTWEKSWISTRSEFP